MFTVYKYSCMYRHKDSSPLLPSGSSVCKIPGAAETAVCLSLFESVLVVLDNLVDAVLSFLIQFCQTEVKGHQGRILLHTFLN